MFRTSGTTLGGGARGSHAMRDVDTYDAAALAFGRRALVHDLVGPEGRVPVLVLGPSPEDSPDSSLVHMMDLFVRRGMYPYGVADIVRWARTGEDPARGKV